MLKGRVEKYHSVVEIDDRHIAIAIDMSIDGRLTASFSIKEEEGHSYGPG
jgi:hypothetical protein